MTEKVSLVHAHTHSWTSASLRMMCTLRYLLKSFVFLFVFWRPSHVAHLAFTLLQAHSATQSGSTDSLVHVLGTLTGQEVIGTSHKNAQKIARRSRKQITDKCPAVFVIVFWGGNAHVNVSRRRERTVCITSLVSPPAMRCQALRIKTDSESKLGQHATIPLSGLEQHPCWVTEEGSRVSAD